MELSRRVGRRIAGLSRSVLAAAAICRVKPRRKAVTGRQAAEGVIGLQGPTRACYALIVGECAGRCVPNVNGRYVS